MARNTVRNRVSLALLSLAGGLFLGSLLGGCDTARLAAINQWFLDHGYTVNVEGP